MVDGYYGTLIEHLSCDKKFYTSVEVVAGSRLFYHIVDSDETSTRLIEENDKMKLPGEPSFMPLNRLDPGRVDMPPGNQVRPVHVIQISLAGVHTVSKISMLCIIHCTAVTKP